MFLAAPLFLLADSPARFDGHRAFEHVRRVVALGPRPAGSKPSEACRAYIRAQVEALGLKVEERAFTAATPLGPIPMANLIVRLPGRDAGLIVIGGHYDTKRLPFPFVGANDGGSSTGFLLELLRALKERPRRLGLEIVFFDGEEATGEWRGEDHTYGSRAYVASAKREGRLGELRTMLLVDMIGDRDLNLRRDSWSTKWLTALLWDAARRLGKGRAFLEETLPVDDDHISFLAEGVPAVDLIDMDYPAWHTAEDTLDKVSAKSLQTVGEVLVEALPKIEQHLLKER
jgi:hypothetical protein